MTIFTKEDGALLVKNGALPEERIKAVETGGCPHAAIHEDISINLGPLEELSNMFKADLHLCESGGDNLAANFSRKLAEYIIYIIDVSAGDNIPRKGFRLEMQELCEKQKEEEVLALKRSMEGGMAQAMKEQARVKEEMVYLYKIGDREDAAAIERRLDPDLQS